VLHVSFEHALQPPNEPGYALVVFWRARLGCANAVRDLLLTLAQQVLNEPGALSFRVHQDSADDHAFVLYELYRSEGAFRDHRASAHFQSLVLEQAVPLLERRDLYYINPLFPLPLRD
jgi:quinol monooxygenase YgiN